MIPSGWNSVRLGDLGVEVKGNVRPRPGVTYELYSVPAFSKGTPEQLDGAAIGSGKRAVERGDLLLCKINPRINRVWWVSESSDGPPTIASTEYLTLKLHEPDPVLLRYLVWYLRSPEFRNWITLNVEGATGSHTRAKSGPILRQTIPLAPEPVRAQIVEGIETQMTRLDAAVAALNRAQARLKTFRASVLQAAATDQIDAPANRGELTAAPSESGAELVDRILAERRSEWMEANLKKKYPEPVEPNLAGMPNASADWAIASLDQLASALRPICYGILMPRTREGGTVPYVEVKDLRKDRLQPDDLHRTTEELHKRYRRSAIRKGDVLVAIRGSWESALVVPPGIQDGNVSRDVARVDVSRLMVNRYVASMLKSPLLQSYFARVARGVAVRGVNIADLKAAPIPVPPAAHQEAIVQELDRRLSIAAEIEAEIRTNLTKAEATRQSLLATAFSGRLGQYP